LVCRLYSFIESFVQRSTIPYKAVQGIGNERTVIGRYVNRPKEIGARLESHFDDVNPQAKRLWALIVQLSILLREQNSPLIKRTGFDLNRGEIRVLTCLRLSSEPHGLRQSEVADRIQMSSGGVTNICKQLANRGWIDRKKDPCDARATLYSLTKEGIAVANEIIPIIHSTEKQLTDCLKDEEVEQLCQLLEKLAAVM